MSNILELLDRPIAYHRVFAEMAGSVTAGVFLSQAVYWSRRTSDPSGFFYKSRDQWTAETFLTRSEQETARKALRLIGVLIEKRGGEDNRLYFRIDAERLTELLIGRQDSAIRSAGIPPSGRQDSAIRSAGIPPSGRQDSAIRSAGFPPTFHAENTTEITHIDSFARAPRRAEKKWWCVSDINQFSEEYLDDSLTAWAGQEAPAVNLDTATRAWIAYHLDHETQHRSRVALLRSWKGWIRNAQTNSLAATAAGKDTHAKSRKAERSPDLDSLRAVGLLH
jgi:hypothetical protein